MGFKDRMIFCKLTFDGESEIVDAYLVLRKNKSHLLGTGI